MKASSNTRGPSALLSLPLELRDYIYSFLIQPQHVYTSSATSDTYTLHRSSKVQPTYVDTRIYFPARFPTNILQTCRQLREECLNFHAYHLNSLIAATLTDSIPLESTTSHRLATRNNTAADESMERRFDDGVVRITLEILRAFRGTMGFFVPTRDVPSPHFMSFLPLLSRVKKMKFIVWAGYDWWSGNSTRPIVNVDSSRRTKPKRTCSDQTDVQQPNVWREEDTSPSQAPRPDRLATAIGTLLRHLPSIEELHVDVLLHVLDFANWDLPEEIKWEGIRGWLDGPVGRSTEGRLKKVQRRLIVVHPTPPILWGTFLRQREECRDREGVFHVERGVRTIADADWESNSLSDEPPYTETYTRNVLSG